MTINAIILDVIILLLEIFFVCYLFSEYEIVHGILGIVCGTILLIGLIIGQFWYYSNTATGIRAIKTQKSEINNGITRSIKVYDFQGELIKEYKGTFDVTYDESRILFDDENNKRHIIYYTTGTVIIDEE